MKKELIKGNDAVVKAAILAGCSHFYGYPITPASEIEETASKYFPLTGRTFLQAESEIGAINMVYGASSAGRRAMTASSGPGMSLKMECMSYLSGAELPAVVVDVMRTGPGLGNIMPEQSDYNQIVKGGGHGSYKTIVLAPNSAQEMCDFTIKAFELADKYRIVSVVFTDGCIGQMMEPVEFPEEVIQEPVKEWAVTGEASTRKNFITSIYMDINLQQELNIRLETKYKKIEENEVLFENYRTDDAELIVVAYGITSRIVKAAIDELRSEGMKIGLHRPQTLFPFPKEELRRLARQVRSFVVCEMSNGQFIDDVKLAIECSKPVHFWNCFGGVIPSVEAIKTFLSKQYK